QVLVLKGVHHAVIGAAADRVRARGEIDAGGKAHAADVEHTGQALEAHGGVVPGWFERARALKQALLPVEVQRGEPGRARQRRSRRADAPNRYSRGTARLRAQGRA